jgi:hypothetical protein
MRRNQKLIASKTSPFTEQQTHRRNGLNAFLIHNKNGMDWINQTNKQTWIQKGEQTMIWMWKEILGTEVTRYITIYGRWWMVWWSVQLWSYELKLSIVFWCVSNSEESK